MLELEGHDSSGRNFKNPDELWQAEADADGSHNSWYKKAVSYWDQQEASYNGVLGGFGYTSDIDIRDSRQLLLKALKRQLEEAEKGQRRLVALDCGAGVGRVSQELLLHHFHEVDLLEPSQHLLETARKNLAEAGGAKPGRGPKRPAGHVAANFFCAGLQEHEFTPARYDVIWIQWCLLYLTDADATTLLNTDCPAALKPDGLIFVKENICRDGFVMDNSDSSLTRSNTYMLELFERAGMQVLYNIKQRNWPKELFEVRTYVLRPRSMAAPAAGQGQGEEQGQPPAGGGPAGMES